MARAGPEKAVRPCWARVRPSYGDFINSAREMRTKTVTLLLYKVNPDFSVKMSYVMFHSEFDSPRPPPKKIEKKKEIARWSYNKMLID